MSNRPILYIVVPCYNEQEVLPITSGMFLNQLIGMIDSGKIADASRILFIDDGSVDDTWALIERFTREDPHFSGHRLEQNCGHQRALLAGLMEARKTADITISIDCDGQDDIAAMGPMVDAYLEGCDVVYGVRNRRDTDSLFKRGTAHLYYKLLRLLGANIIFDHADYRLLSVKALDGLDGLELDEENLFLRGVIPTLGYKSTCVEYRRTERLAGKTKYSIGKMLKLAVNGVCNLKK